MEKRVLTVLRTGGEYTDEHVLAIKRQLAKYAPDVRLVCLTDSDVAGVECVPLYHDWPGWWSKIELFRPTLGGNFLYTDLDNVIMGPIDFAFEAKEFTADIGFSFFRMTPDFDRAAVLAEFVADPEAHMAEWNPRTRNDGKFGDAAFLRSTCGLSPAAWGAQVRNVVDLQRYPWHEHRDVSLERGVSVILCGGRRRRPWTHPSQGFRKTYWCR